ncbi:DUF169 domain-containing protein [Desulfotomaculum copahuensis]|uniref:DUF169 domain-containing protein n=1 Tax=Desulfotomaculum copahuensis TaxID=1838280 RepID=A0A1B7LDX2_9FIRM|nr:DUF169 domain-containing protein [Desulfotomaculum copahuensis]OAT81306.1 hypothetical protein A6M21_00475 [Desulfotomaculum copahuensis]
MVGNTDWNALIRKIEALLRLKTFPVGLKLLENKEELDRNKWARRPAHKTTLCQLITMVRTYDWTVGATAGDFPRGMCASVAGLAEPPAQVLDGTFRSLVWCRTKADGEKCEASIPRIPAGRYQAVLLAPQVYSPFEPDMVLIYGNAAQMILIINALQFADYERMQFFCSGEGSCADAIAQCHLTGKPALTIPCFGERRFGHVQDDELYIALPPAYMEKMERNLEALYSRGVQYPVPYHGTACDPLPGMPPGYHELAAGKVITGLGVPPRKVSRW